MEDDLLDFDVGDKEFFKQLDKFGRSRSFVQKAAQTMRRATCLMLHLPYDSGTTMTSQEIAHGYAPVPAVIAAASYLAYIRANETCLEGGPIVTRIEFIGALRSLSVQHNLTDEDRFVVGLFGHAAWHAAQPVDGCESYFTVPLDQKRRTLMVMGRAARLVLDEIDVPDTIEEDGCMVFLGGACNPTTWRRDIVVPFLERANVSFYNPQVDCWSPELVPLEAAAKQKAEILFFVVSAMTRGMASLVEVTEFITSRRTIIIVCEEVHEEQLFNGTKVTKDEMKDLNRGRVYMKELAARSDIPVYGTIEAGLEALAVELERVEATRAF